MTYRIIFSGTPEFAVPGFKALYDYPLDSKGNNKSFEIVGVMTQPDRPAGRGQKLTVSPIKQIALDLGIPLKQPSRLRKEPEMMDWLRSLKPDFLVTAAFGQILSQEVLDIPKFGTVNVHASLLPRYRGPNPVQWTIINGDAKTGVTIMLTELGVDSGPMLMWAETDIDPNEDSIELAGRLSRLGAEILPQSLLRFASGELKPTFQDESQVTLAPKLENNDAVIDWFQPALTIHNRVRGSKPSPGAVTSIEGHRIKLIKTRSPLTFPSKPEDLSSKGKPGEILGVTKEGIIVQTGDVPLLLEVLQPPGKPQMAASSWANGSLRQISEKRFESVNPDPK